jgi:thiamine-phosphate pyrophosphorylase|tara:strand:- start:133 stop:747 length:615 start_codon:yes stop_codon:yes gene_type:complete
LRINNKKYIYLISPLKIKKSFYNDLIEVLKYKKVSFFQLRLKKENFKKKLLIGKKIKEICKKYDVKFLINDDVNLSKKLDADGCHLGQKDMNILEARKLIGNKIIGITCHNSIKLANIAVKNKADYIAFGAFYSSKTKKVKYKAPIQILRKARKIIKTPIVAIGGINSSNYKKLLLNKANFLAISSYVWKNKKLKPLDAIKKLI